MGKETAEQKLLKLIEVADTDAGDTSAPAAAAPAASTAQQTLAAVKGGGIGVSPVHIIQQIAGLFQGGSASPHSFGLRELNIAMAVAVLVLGWIFFQTLTGGMTIASQDADFSLSRKPQISARELFKPLKDLSAYLALAQQRNIFTPYIEKIVEVEAEVPAPEPNQMINARLETLRLVGVSWLDSADTVTVMIEDTKTQITYFLKEGEDLEGVRVDKIYTDRVDLSYQGESATMSL